MKNDIYCHTLTGIFKLHGGEFGKQKLARIDLTKFTNRIMCGASEAVIKVDIDPFFWAKTI